MFFSKIRNIILPVICVLFSFKVSAMPFASVGVGVMDGIILEGGYKFNPFLAVYARGAYLNKTSIPSFSVNAIANIQTSGNNLFSSASGTLMSQSFDIGGELRPIPIIPILSKFTIIGSLRYLDADINVFSSVNGSTEINGTNYNVNNGYFDIRISNKQKIAPYFGIGFDIISCPWIGLPSVILKATVGGTFRSFKVERQYYNLPGVLDSQAQAEIEKLSNRINNVTFVPSATLHLRIQL